MITVDMRDRKPIYEQLIENIRSQAVQGYLKPDEHLPSVRQLAAELAINPNTIQKAYAELERQGVIYSLPGRGNFISPDIGAVAKQELGRQMHLLEAQLQQTKNAGAAKEDILALLDAVFDTTTNRKDG
ncbi:MAG: GntR family transcriptional regulator [Clostridia bacterium]|nr:GntR family transcriptional regulator [Clostridia bacterium]